MIEPARKDPLFDMRMPLSDLSEPNLKRSGEFSRLASRMAAAITINNVRTRVQTLIL